MQIISSVKAGRQALPDKKIPVAKTGMKETAPFGPTRFPPPFCEVVEKYHSQAVDLAYEIFLRKAAFNFDYSCATAPDLHRFRLSAFPSGKEAPGNRLLNCVHCTRGSPIRQDKPSPN